MIERWFAVPHKLRFLIAGGFNTALGYSLVFVGQFLLGGSLSPQVIFILGYFVSSISSFTVMKRLVFRTTGNYFREYLKYLLSSAGSAFAGTVVLPLFVHFFGGNEYVGQFIAMTASVITSYILLQYYAFRDKGSGQGKTRQKK